jgi:drug/metabolite transporter (DMT)-like permease
MSWRAWIAFTALCVIWGIPYLLVKLAVAEVSPVCVAWMRVALGAAILLPVAWQRGALRSVRAHWAPACAFAFAELIGPFFLIAQGERWVSSSLAGILIATMPFLVILLSRLFGLSEALGVRRAVGMVIGFTGVAVLLGIGSVEWPLGWAGVSCILLATLGYALGSLIVQRYLAGVDELGAVTASLCIATVVLAFPALASLPPRWPSLSASVSLLVLGVACTALALVLYFYLIAQAGAARAAIITYVNPAVAALLGVTILHEPFGIGSAVGLLAILAGSWLATSRAGLGQSESMPA